MIKKIKCLRWVSNNNLVLEERMMPKIKENEALLKVESCGICGSDLKILKFGNKRVKSGQITGHEIAGKIIDINNSKSFQIGDRISLGADIPFEGKNDYAIGHELEGGFSQFMVINEHTLNFGPIKKINDLDYDLACMAEPLACCINGFEKVSFQFYESVLIMGCGPIGLMLAFLAHNNGIKNIYMSDISKTRLDLVKKFDFITSTNNTSNKSLKVWISGETNNKGVDLIFTANNNINSHYDALSIIRNKTVINFFGGLPSNSPEISISTNQLHYQESILTGSHGSTPSQHSKAVDLIQNNQYFFKNIISKKYSLEEFKTAFESASNSSNLKVIINPNQ